uniref:Uncharacterized protein n=1 Tax=Timema cristinae TaxID=61476 RepID=A0A7R9D0A1_TIMCR|nr:unnamed protein product [Timema cristinae]
MHLQVSSERVTPISGPGGGVPLIPCQDLVDFVEVFLQYPQSGPSTGVSLIPCQDLVEVFLQYPQSGPSTETCCGELFYRRVRDLLWRVVLEVCKRPAMESCSIDSPRLGLTNALRVSESSLGLLLEPPTLFTGPSSKPMQALISSAAFSEHFLFPGRGVAESSVVALDATLLSLS